MRVTIEGPDGPVLDMTMGAENVLVPLDENERAAARVALVKALALLADVGGPPANDEAERYFEERRASIRRGARTVPPEKRFRP